MVFDKNCQGHRFPSEVQTLLPSLTPKEASTAAAIVGGIGLLAAPMEQAEADVPIVSEVKLTGWSFSSDSKFDMEVVHSAGYGTQWNRPKYCWSGIYDFSWIPLGWSWINAEDYSYFRGSELNYHTGSSKTKRKYFHPANRWDYYICKIAPFNWRTLDVDTSLGWVEVWFYTGDYYFWTDSYAPPSAYVYDSEGNWYYPTLTIE